MSKDARPVIRGLALGLAAVVLGACGSFKKDMENACHAMERSKVRELPLLKEEDFLTMAASWAGERTQTKEGRRFWDAIANVTPLSKAEVFRDAAKEAGIEDCPFADQLEAAVLADELERQQRLEKRQQQSAPSDTSPAPGQESKAVPYGTALLNHPVLSEHRYSRGGPQALWVRR